MSQIAIFMTVRTQPGKRDELKALWEQHLKPLAAQNAMQSRYVYAFDNSDENVIRIMEVYESMDAVQANAGATWFADYMELVVPLLDGKPEFHMCSAQWVK